MSDDSEDEYLARNNKLILKEMSLLKERLFGKEACSSSPATRSLCFPRSSPRSTSLGFTEPRNGESSRDFSASVQEETTRSPIPFLQRPILEKFPEAERRLRDRTPVPSPIKKTVGSPTVFPPIPAPTNLEPALKLQSPRQFEVRPQTVENPPIPVVTRQPKSSPVPPHPSARFGSQQYVEREGVPRKPTPLEVLLSANESNTHSEWIPEPSFHHRSPIRSRAEIGGSWGRERSRPVLPLFEPSEQSTRVNETAGNVFPLSTANQLSPNDAVLASPSDQSCRSNHSAPREYGDMFTEERRRWAEEDRMKERQERLRTNQQMNMNTSSFEDSSRPSTSLARRPILLPPQSKGKKKSEPETRNVSSDFEFMNQQLEPAWNQPSQRPQTVPTIQGEEEFPSINLTTLTPEDCEGKNFAELQQIVNQFYESGPRLKFKETYPYMAEGMVQKDCQTKMLKVFSSRLGRTMFTDARNSTSDDYVYFLVVGPGEFRGFYYDTHPKCLISAKFPSVERLVVRGYAILAHPNSRSDSLKESRWICWNDSLGLMSIISGAARIPLKKQPVWDKQLDIISIHANFENNKFVVTKIVALTNSWEKKQQFPNEVFLIRDPVYVNTIEDDVIFSSKTLGRNIHIKRVLVGEVDLGDNSPFELVVVPTFPRSTTLQFRALLLIHMPSTFWSRDKEWIREILVKKTESYRY